MLTKVACKLFNTISSTQLAASIKRGFATPPKDFLQKYDSSQTSFMMNEHLILVDFEDQVKGNISKYEAHTNELNKDQLPHRAFSVFLFDQENRLLLHQRSAKKITFPKYWTNACCSHPLFNESEMEIPNNIGSYRSSESSNKKA